MVADNPLSNAMSFGTTSWKVHPHNWTWRKKNDLFPHSATLLLANGMNLVQDDPKGMYFRR
jgi:hypothetical protein